MNSTLDELTKTELEVLRLMACGLTYSQIARLRHTTYGTACRTHGQNILSKLGVNSMTQAALIAWRNGVIGIDEAWETLQKAKAA